MCGHLVMGENHTPSFGFDQGVRVHIFQGLHLTRVPYTVYQAPSTLNKEEAGTSFS